MELSLSGWLCRREIIKSILKHVRAMSICSGLLLCLSIMWPYL